MSLTPVRLNLEKFPVIVHQDHAAIWDLRQPAVDSDEQIFVLEGVLKDTKTIEGLRVRAQKSALKAFVPKDSRLVWGVPVDSVERLLGQCAAQSLGHPSRSMCVLGITGTNGKTSCAEILKHLLLKHHPTGGLLRLGTLGAELHLPDGSVQSVETGFTTPQAPMLQSLLAQVQAWGVQYVVMEVSSHALDMGRVECVDFNGGIFTNLTQDHLDHHGTMEDYFTAKAGFFSDYLFKSLKSKKWSVICGGDNWAQRLENLLDGSRLQYSRLKAGKSFKVLSSTPYGQTLKWRDEHVNLQIPGAFNAMNALACAELMLGLDMMSVGGCAQALESFEGTPGRLQRAAPGVFVDYAHTPDALEKVLEALRETLQEGARLITVMGCGGDRDTGKRPLMGEIAARLSHYVFVTNDNPRSETPQHIANQIMAGIAGDDALKVEVVLDRKEAITKALSLKSEDDVVVVCGKGHEDYQIIGDQKIHFSDVETVRGALGLSVRPANTSS